MGVNISATCDLLEIDSFREAVKECAKVNWAKTILDLLSPHPSKHLKAGHHRPASQTPF